jgi:hypothetical protein
MPLQSPLPLGSYFPAPSSTSVCTYVLQYIPVGPDPSQLYFDQEMSNSPDSYSRYNLPQYKNLFMAVTNKTSHCSKFKNTFPTLFV